VGRLHGRRILITRARHQADDLARRLREEGAIVSHVPVIAIQKPPSYDALDARLRDLASYRWVVFTSQNAVWATCARLEALGSSAAALRSVHVASIGPATSHLLRAVGVEPLVEPQEARAEGLVEAFRAFDLRGVRILLPRSPGARDVLPRELRAMGAEVDEVVAYQTEVAYDQQERLEAILREGIDALTLMSPSAARALVELLGGPHLPEGVRVVCIGPITAEAARALGLRVDARADVYTAEGLVRALVDLFEGRE
jgi:uroporphyrinogen III methyltransferase/synthase